MLLPVWLQDELAAIKGSSREAEQLQQQVEEQSITIRSLQVRRRRTLLPNFVHTLGGG
jgi:hypothetical protein